MFKIQGISEQDLEYWREQLYFITCTIQILKESNTPFKEERDKAIARLKNDNETYLRLYHNDLKKMWLQQTGHRRHFYKD